LKKIIIFCAFFLALTAAAYCGQPNKIELIDGSVSNGEIKVEAKNVAKIEPTNEVTTSAQALMKNPENMAIIAGLASNPQFQEMVRDPQIQAAAKRGDIQTLMQNAKFMNIVNSPETQEAVKKLKQ